MSNFRVNLQDLDAGEFLDVVGDVVREQTRRSTNKSPGEMQPAEFERWAAGEIKKSEQAKAAAKEQGNGSE